MHASPLEYLDMLVLSSTCAMHDRIFTIKLGLSQSLMVQEGAHNTNVTLKSYPKKFWGLFGQKAHKTQQIALKTQQITLFHPKKRFILEPHILRKDLQLKMYPLEVNERNSRV